MISKIKDFFSSWWFLGIIVILQTIVLLAAPNEKTLGSGIKPVYLHVSLTWAGMLFLLLAGVLGVLLVVFGREKLAVWYQSVFTTAFGLYLVGFLISMYASIINWGGIPFQEPRIRNAINVVVAGVAAWTFVALVRPVRLKGGAVLFPLAFIFFAQQSDRMVLHPDNPVSTAPNNIQSTFLTMFVLALVLAVWLLGMFYRKYSGSGGDVLPEESGREKREMHSL